MRTVIRSGLLALALLPSTLAAQGTASGNHELGLVFTYVYGKPDGGESSWVMGTPVNIRIGFVTTKRIMYETAFSFEGGGSNGSSSIAGGAGVAALFAKDHRRGAFLFGDVALAFFGQTDEKTGLAPSVGGGIGTRLPRGSAAIRLDAFARYVFESSNDAPSATRIGIRAGFSFWH